MNKKGEAGMGGHELTIRENIQNRIYTIRSVQVMLDSDNLRFQNGTSSDHGGRRYLPYAFTEQGVAMLSAVLKSETAVKISIQIINAFVAMRRFIGANAQVFQRLDTLEIKQLETDKKMERVLNAIESKEVQPKQGIFFDGQIFDAYKFVAQLVQIPWGQNITKIQRNCK